MYISFNNISDYGEVPYPEGYRHWAHVKTAIVGHENPFMRFRGMHHIYANDLAMKGYVSGKFPDGSVIVFDLLEIKTEPNTDIVEGERKFIDVMVKDSLRYDSTGGWGFEEFNKNSLTERNILNLSKQKCFNCHAKTKPTDFVFSAFRK
ncbi:MAG: cytochrome P460 family protein [Flammeovirgaceae bacterium]|nr:cytochrome P460 family protein [Flammeovirgaceae bacterium]